MKTQINLQDYQFSGKNNPLFQISDDPVNKLVRVIEINRAEYLLDIDMMSIKGTTYYINPELKIVVFATSTEVNKKPWDIVKGDQTIKIDEKYQPIPNPDFDKSKPVSKTDNYPYMLTDAFEQFKTLSINLLSPMLTMFVAANDNNKLFD